MKLQKQPRFFQEFLGRKNWYHRMGITKWLVPRPRMSREREPMKPTVASLAATWWAGSMKNSLCFLSVATTVPLGFIFHEISTNPKLQKNIAAGAPLSLPKAIQSAEKSFMTQAPPRTCYKSPICHRFAHKCFLKGALWAPDPGLQGSL